jgi:putative ABC transport system ATP-binding protein
MGQRLDHRAETLSMGERQRVMIARALSTGPRLLLADEPTGSLDTERSREVLELLRELCRERQVAVLLVSHDPMAALFADRVLGLLDGRLSDDENVEEYLADGRAYARLPVR